MPESVGKLWESIYIEHITELNMNIRKYPHNYIFEFDTLDELRLFDRSYIAEGFTFEAGGRYAYYYSNGKTEHIS